MIDPAGLQLALIVFAVLFTPAAIYIHRMSEED